MNARKITLDFQQLQAMREHHLQQLRRIDDAIALARDIHKLSLRAEKTMSGVRARAADDGVVGPRGGTSATARYHAAHPEKYEAEKVRARKRYHKTKRARRAQALLTNSATPRPIDHVRAAFASAKGRALSRDVLQELLLEHMPTKGGPANLPPEGKANRVLGLTLSQLVKGREVKRTSSGYVATRSLFMPPSLASVNGASAE